jgi:Metallo-peptidase family M12
VYGLSDLEVVDVYSSDAQYILDGEPIALPSVTESRTLIGKSRGGDTIMITKGMSDEIHTLDIFGPDGSDEYMATVKPGVLASITADDLDLESLKKFTMGDMVFLDGEEENDEAEPFQRALKGAPLLEGRYLRAKKKQREVVSPGGAGDRFLQSSGCSSFRVIEVALAFDSTFCAKQGGEQATRQEIERIVARASLMYQAQGVCTKLVISHLEGFCSSSQDPYRAGVNTNDIGCSGQNGLLQAFKQYWQVNRGSVRRDAAHLFYARDLAGSSVGCATVRVLCSTSNAYGVNEMEFSTDQQRRAIVFTHELGHNIGTSFKTNNIVLQALEYGS